jgi:hypothetical protein
MKNIPNTIMIAALCTIGGVRAASGQSRPTDSAQVVDVVRTVFVAARSDDVAKFDSLIAPGFYIYEAGKRFNGDSIMGLIKALHAAGKQYQWNVTEPDVHTHGTTAWIAYVNQGSVTDTSGTLPLEWLESAVLEKRAGKWKIVFMHSTRVPAPPHGS